MYSQLTLNIFVLLMCSALTMTTSPPVTCVIDYDFCCHFSNMAAGHRKYLKFRLLRKSKKTVRYRGSASALLVSLTTCMQYVEDVTNVTVVPISVVTKCLNQYPAAGVLDLLQLLNCIQVESLTTAATGTPVSPVTPPSIVLTSNTTLTCVINTGNATLIQSSFNQCFTNISNALTPSNPINQDLQQLTQCLSSLAGISARFDAIICVYDFLNSLNTTATTTFEFVTTATHAPSSFESTITASSVSEEASGEHTTLTAHTVPSTPSASSSSDLTSIGNNVTVELSSVTSSSLSSSSSDLTSIGSNVTVELSSVTSSSLSSSSVPDVTIEHSFSTEKLLSVTTGLLETSTREFTATVPTTAPDRNLTSVSGHAGTVTITDHVTSASFETSPSIASESAQTSYYISTQKELSSTKVTVDESGSTTSQQHPVSTLSVSFNDVTGHSSASSTFSENTATAATSGVKQDTITAETTRSFTVQDITNSRLPYSAVTTENTQSITESTSTSRIKLTSSLATSHESSTITSASSGSNGRSENSSIAGSGVGASNVTTAYSISTTPITEVSIDVSPNPSSGLSAGAIAGIVIGSVVGAALLAGAAIAAVHYMRRRRLSEKYKLDNDKTKIMRQESFCTRAID